MRRSRRPPNHSEIPGVDPKENPDFYGRGVPDGEIQDYMEAAIAAARDSIDNDDADPMSAPELDQEPPTEDPVE